MRKFSYACFHNLRWEGLKPIHHIWVSVCVHWLSTLMRSDIRSNIFGNISNTINDTIQPYIALDIVVADDVANVICFGCYVIACASSHLNPRPSLVPWLTQAAGFRYQTEAIKCQRSRINWLGSKRWQLKLVEMKFSSHVVIGAHISQGGGTDNAKNISNIR